MPFVGNQKVEFIERTAPSRGSDGRIEASTETSFPDQDATVNPITGDELAALPEGDRLTRNVRVITEYEITEGADGEFPTILVYEGERYEARGKVQKYRRVIPHNAARFILISPEV